MTEVRGGQARELAGVLFDYGETLVHFTRPKAALAGADERIVAVLEASGKPALTARQLRSVVLDRVERDVNEHLGSGNLAEINVVDAARRAYLAAGLDLGADVLDEVLRIEQEAWWQGAQVDPEAIQVLDALRAGGIRVGLCSNAPYRVRSLYAQLTHLGLTTHLDAVTFSGEVGWRKPSPIIFDAALRALGTQASRTVMVGDSEAHDIAGAHASGMRAVLVRRADTEAASAADAVITRLGDLAVALQYGALY